LVDSTPCLGQREQLSQVIRYVAVDFAFQGSVEVQKLDAVSLKNFILESLKYKIISLVNCRSPCCDHAAVMTGHISGLQQHICAEIPKALLVKCNSNS